MPIYEYQCDACGHRVERIQKFSDPPLAACPLCGASVRKLLSSPAIQFKGSGFYITDYAKSGQSGKDKDGSGESAKGKGSGSDRAAAEKPADKAASTSEKSSSEPSGKTDGATKPPAATSK